MPRKIPLLENEYYHLYSRGVDKRLIFLDEKDRERFTKLMFLCNADVSVVMEDLHTFSFDELIGRFKGRSKLTAIGAYTLMPNHFHILVKETVESGISRFMQKLLTAYSMYFNRKYKRSGSLFESRFKSSHVNEDNYLQYLFAYIHLNPVKLIDPAWKEEGLADLEKTKDFLERYLHSSYLAYRGVKRPENALLECGEFPKYFEDHKEFDHFIESWLICGEDEKQHPEPLPQLSPALEHV